MKTARGQYWKQTEGKCRPANTKSRGDILPLVHHFVEVYRRRLNIPPVMLSRRAEQALFGYAWPGNTRELESAIHFALIMCATDVLDEPDLRLPQRGHPHWSPAETGGSGAPADPIDGLVGALHQLLDSGHGAVHDIVQKALVTAAFEHAHRNQVRAAMRLGITCNILLQTKPRHADILKYVVKL